MLQHLRLENWTSFGEGPLARHRLVFSPLTLLVGPNASGKSNVLDALRFLQGMALDYPLGDVLRGRWEGQRQVWPGIRGQLPEAPRTNHQSFAIESSWRLGTTSLGHVVEVDVKEDAALARERLSDADGDLFDTHGGSLGSQVGRSTGGAIKVALQCRGRGRWESQERSAASSLLGQLEVAGRVESIVIQRAHALRQVLRDVVFLEIQPTRMRDYRPDSATSESRARTSRRCSPHCRARASKTFAIGFPSSARRRSPTSTSTGPSCAK